jgi:hypothetical protein
MYCGYIHVEYWCIVNISMAEYWCIVNISMAEYWCVVSISMVEYWCIVKILMAEYWYIADMLIVDIPKGRSESVNRSGTENTMAKRKSTKGQTTIYKTYT